MKKIILRIFIIQLIIITIIFAWVYYNKFPYENKEDSPISREQTKVDKHFLDKDSIYTYFEKALLEGRDQIDIDDNRIFKDVQEIFDLLEEISNRNPQVMYYKGAEYYFGKLKIHYSMSKEDIRAHQEEVKKIGENFIRNNITEDMSEYEKILKVHDYIIENSTYDKSSDQLEYLPPESNSSYGILALGVGVCEGYAKAMKYLLDLSKVESIIVVGKSRGENHAWNLVEIEGEYYHIDPTWDDPITNDGSEVLRYNYFNLSDDQISKSHSWNRESYPSANGYKYNYYVYNELVTKLDEIENKIENTMAKKDEDLTLKISDYNLESINLKDIIDEIIYSSSNIYKLKSYGYSLDKDQFIVNLTFKYY